MSNRSQNKAIVVTTWKEGIFISGTWSPHTSLILFPPLLFTISTELFPLSLFLTTVKQTLSSFLKPCLCLSHLLNRISQRWELRKWDRKHCVRKPYSSFSIRGALMHGSISILVFIPLHVILMSLQLPLHYFSLVKSISNLQAWRLLLVTLRHAGGAVNANWYFRCRGALWLPETGLRGAVWFKKQWLRAYYVSDVVLRRPYQYWKGTVSCLQKPNG